MSTCCLSLTWPTSLFLPTSRFSWIALAWKRRWCELWDMRHFVTCVLLWLRWVGTNDPFFLRFLHRETSWNYWLRWSKGSFTIVIDFYNLNNLDIAWSVALTYWHIQRSGAHTKPYIFALLHPLAALWQDCGGQGETVLSFHVLPHTHKKRIV